MSHCFAKIAIAVPRVYPGDVRKNVDEISSLLRTAAANGADAFILPPSPVSGASCGDLFGHALLASATLAGEAALAAEAESLGIKAVIASNDTLDGVKIIREHICETVCGHEFRLSRLRDESKGRLLIYCSSGYGESTGDGVCSGDAFAFEDGRLTAQSERYAHDSRLTYVTSGSGSITDVAEYVPTSPVDPMPFVPADKEESARRCREIFNIQRNALACRMEKIGCKTAVIGISGGLDSTLAVLATCETFDWLGLDRKGIIAVTMPGFGTSDRTRDNAGKLMDELGVNVREVPIGPSVMLHFKDIGHNPEIRNATYENAQARERTQILMDIANDCGGIVIGTGDLSESALGWCTYNGDHMSMYSINCGIPKTLVREMVAYAASNGFSSCASVLKSILDTPISPELIPGQDGSIGQKTEELVGSYELNDFFLYHFVRHGRKPSEIKSLAEQAFTGKFDAATIEKWLGTFIKRFFNSQFKRSCCPDGPRTGTVCLSPRGAWMMPSDMSCSLWLEDLD